MNLGVIAGNRVTGEWALRLMNDNSRVARFAGAQTLGACLGVIARLTETVADNGVALDDGLDAVIDGGWLEGLAAEYNNIIQFTPPASVMAGTVDEAIDRIFQFRIEEPQRRKSPAGWLTRNTLKAAQREAFVDVSPNLVHEGSELFVGANVSSKMDFALANGHTTFLSHGWSFLVGGVDEVGTQIKAWAYAVERLRNSEKARLMRSDGVFVPIEAGVDLAVLISSAQTPEQHSVREESLQVLSEIQATMIDFGNEVELRKLAAKAIA